MNDQSAIAVGLSHEMGALEQDSDRVIARHLTMQLRRGEAGDRFRREKDILAGLLGNRLERVGQGLRRQGEIGALGARCPRRQDQNADATEKICADLP